MEISESGVGGERTARMTSKTGKGGQDHVKRNRGKDRVSKIRLEKIPRKELIEPGVTSW